MAKSRLFFHWTFKFIGHVFTLISLATSFLGFAAYRVAEMIVPSTVVQGDRAMQRVGVNPLARQVFSSQPRVVTDTGQQISKHPTSIRDMPSAYGGYRGGNKGPVVRPEDIPF